MNKRDLFWEVAAKTGLSRDDAARAVDLVYGHIAGVMRAGGKLTIRGFGTFTWREKKEWDAPNPKNGTVTRVPARRMPHFEAGTVLKDIVNDRRPLPPFPPPTPATRKPGA